MDRQYAVDKVKECLEQAAELLQDALNARENALIDGAELSRARACSLTAAKHFVEAGVWVQVAQTLRHEEGRG